MLLFIFMVISERVSDKKTKEHIMKNQMEVQSFAIQLSNLPLLPEDELKVTLKHHFEGVLQEEWKKRKYEE